MSDPQHDEAYRSSQIAAARFNEQRQLEQTGLEVAKMLLANPIRLRLTVSEPGEYEIVIPVNRPWTFTLRRVE